MDEAPNLPIKLQGQLLIADPSLRDGFFNRSVILLTDHHYEDGATASFLIIPPAKLSVNY